MEFAEDLWLLQRRKNSILSLKDSTYKDTFLKTGERFIVDIYAQNFGYDTIVVFADMHKSSGSWNQQKMHRYL